MANQIPIVLSAGRQRQIPNTDNLVTFGYVVATGTITSSRPMIDLSQTWNSGAVSFEGAVISITNINSAAASRAFKIKVGGVELVSVDVNGVLYCQSLTVVGQAFADSFIATSYITTPAINNLNTDGAIMTTATNGTLEVEEKANAVFELALFYSAY